MYFAPILPYRFYSHPSINREAILFGHTIGHESHRTWFDVWLFGIEYILRFCDWRRTRRCQINYAQSLLSEWCKCAVVCSAEGIFSIATALRISLIQIVASNRKGERGKPKQQQITSATSITMENQWMCSACRFLAAHIPCNSSHRNVSMFAICIVISSRRNRATLPMNIFWSRNTHTNTRPRSSLGSHDVCALVHGQMTNTFVYS